MVKLAAENSHPHPNSIYLERYSYGHQLIDIPPDPDLEMVVVIPCYFEPEIIKTLRSLAGCHAIPGKVEILVVINQSSSDSPEVIRHNNRTLKEIGKWVAAQSSWLSFYTLCQTLPDKHAGVGLARKIGMDEAIRRFHQIGRQGIIVCLDADCTCAPNYLQAIRRHFQEKKNTPGCSIYFEHPLEGPLSSENYQAIAAYEMHLRYYVHGLRYAGLPCAFQTVGSAMAVRSAAYEKQGGMNKRKAGEDFYFLQKIIKLGGFTELPTTTVYPSPRVSRRVPFGTGKAMHKYLQPAVTGFYSYHPDTFRDLKKLTDSVPELYPAPDSDLPEIWGIFGPALKGFFDKESFIAQVQNLRKKTSTAEAFEKQFYQWCDGFFAFRFANIAREHYPPVPVGEAAGWLLHKVYGVEPTGNKVKELLMQFRLVDKQQGIN